jgi:hypothetical protein
MNAALQLFSYIIELRDYLCNREYLNDLNKIKSNGNITKALGIVIENLWSSKNYYYT